MGMLNPRGFFLWVHHATTLRMQSSVPIDLVDKLLGFLAEIGIPCRLGTVRDTFLPGIEVENGGLTVDLTTLKYPGDILHEAGHLAVAPADLRPSLSGEVVVPNIDPTTLELQAMLWSYAACLYLDIEPSVVFHLHGYHGRSAGLLTNFELGVFIGVQGLEASGMTLSPRDAERLGMSPFPVMQKWLRD